MRGRALDKENRVLILVLVLMAQFMAALDATIVMVALPSIQNSLHIETAGDLQWVINGYTLLFGGFLLFAEERATCSVDRGCWSPA